MYTVLKDRGLGLYLEDRVGSIESEDEEGTPRPTPWTTPKERPTLLDPKG
jgi:hypothetical protein